MKKKMHKQKPSWIKPKVVAHGDVVDITHGKTWGSYDCAGYEGLNSGDICT